MADYEEASDQEKARIVSSFLLHAPPGEFNEVFNDCRILLNNDRILKEDCAGAFAQYNKEQFTPCKIDADHLALVSEFAEVGAGRFFDPRTNQTFSYDHLRKEARDFQPSDPDRNAESWRHAFETAFTTYAKSHYPAGVASVYGSFEHGNVTIILCLEDHKFSPHNFWNGRWRSQWSVTFPSSGGCTAEIKGVFKVQVHYYEDGNVQTVCCSEVKDSVNITNNETETANGTIKIVEDRETDYQNALMEAQRVMSETTFKALRRPLPVTRNKIDWNKILSYKIGSELKRS